MARGVDTEVRLQQAAEAERLAAGTRSLLENPAVSAAFERLEAVYTSAWRHSAPGATTDREHAFMMLRALDALKADLESVVTGGRVAAHNVRMLNRPDKRGI